MAIDTRGARAARRGRRVAAALAAAGLSVISPVVLSNGLLGSEVTAWLSFAVAMALVAAATAVGTVWSGLAVGPLLAVPPVSVVIWIEVSQESDPQAPILSVFVVLMACSVSYVSYVVVSNVVKKRGEGWPDRPPALSMR